MGTKAIQITHVVYMAKPMNLASLKFSGTLRVLMAYSVHKAISKKSKARGATTPSGVVLQASTTRSRVGNSSVGAAGSSINMVIATPTSTPISEHVMSTWEFVLCQGLTEENHLKTWSFSDKLTDDINTWQSDLCYWQTAAAAAPVNLLRVRVWLTDGRRSSDLTVPRETVS